jgi:hypothetical protein
MGHIDRTLEKECFVYRFFYILESKDMEIREGTKGLRVERDYTKGV